MLQQKPHFALLDGLRGVAALAVLWYHVNEGFAFAQATNGAGDGLIRSFNHGYLAVDFFFLLSGFVIAYAYDDRWSKGLSIGSFFKRRLIRLHPMLIAGAIIGAITFLIQGGVTWSGEAVSTSAVLLCLALTFLFIPSVPGGSYEVRGNGEMFPLNGPGWSLFFEYIGNICYALFMRRMSTKVLAFFTLLLGIAHAWFFIGDISQYDMIGVGWTIDAVNFWGGFIRMLFPFSMGMLLARTFKPRKVKGAFWICTCALIVLFAVPYIPSGSCISLNSLYEFICIAIVFPGLVWLGACGTENGPIRKANRFLGEISYPLYIVHYPLMYIFYAWLIKNNIYTLSGCWPVALLVIVSSIALAYLCLKFYDEPIRRRLSQSRR